MFFLGRDQIYPSDKSAELSEPLRWKPSRRLERIKHRFSKISKTGWWFWARHPSEKYESVGMIIPFPTNWMESHSKFHGSSNHQPEKVTGRDQLKTIEKKLRMMPSLTLRSGWFRNPGLQDQEDGFETL